jgi:hypothetical protein
MAVKTFPAVSDHSWARPPAEFIRNSGYIGVGRYLGYDTNGRDIGLNELESYWRANVKVFFIVQGDNNTVNRGWEQGVRHAQMANERLAALRIPEHVVIISTVVDYDAPLTDLRNGIAQYARGFANACRWRHIPYGSDKTLDVLCGELGLFPCGWQTRAWSGGRTSRFACMTQEVGYVLGNTSDHNNVLNMDDVERLLWHPDENVPAPPDPTPEEDDEVGTTYVVTSGSHNQKWLTKKDRTTGLSPGEIAGLTNADGQPIGADGALIDGGWGNSWAGLCSWEMVDGCMTMRPLTNENATYLKGIGYAQAIQGDKVTVVAIDFPEDVVFVSKTVIPGTVHA